MPSSRPSSQSAFRQVVRNRRCPKCGAGVDQLCIGPSGPRLSNHQERVDLTTGGDTAYWRVKRSRSKRRV